MTKQSVFYRRSVRKPHMLLLHTELLVSLMNSKEKRTLPRLSHESSVVKRLDENRGSGTKPYGNKG